MLKAITDKTFISILRDGDVTEGWIGDNTGTVTLKILLPMDGLSKYFDDTCEESDIFIETSELFDKRIEFRIEIRRWFKLIEILGGIKEKMDAMQKQLLEDIYRSAKKSAKPR